MTIENQPPDLTDDQGPTVNQPDADDFDEATDSHRRSKVTVVLAAAIIAAIGFLAGATVSNRSAQSTTALPSGLPAGLPALLQGGSLPAGIPGGPNATTGSATTTAPTVVGTVVDVTGDVVTVEDLGGNRYEISTSDITTITRNRQISTSQLDTGQQVQVFGTRSSTGSVEATSITAR